MTSKQLRVLVVDDEESFRKPLQRFFQDEYGYVVETTDNGETALHMVEQAQVQFDVAVIDQLLLQGPNGIETALRLKAVCPEIGDHYFDRLGSR